MCLGANARAANERARRQYKFENEKRKRNWLQSLSIWGAKKVRGLVNIDRARGALTDKYGFSQLKRRQAFSQARVAINNKQAELLKNSKFASLVASGRTGKTVGRVGTIETGDLGRYVSEVGRQLRTNDFVLKQGDLKAWRKTNAYIDNQEASFAFQPMPGVAPPQPVMQNVGWAMFTDALSIGSSIMGMGIKF